MNTQNASLAEKTKRKGFPVGRLGANVKGGIKMTYSYFFYEYNQKGLPRIGEASIKP